MGLAHSVARKHRLRTGDARPVGGPISNCLGHSGKLRIHALQLQKRSKILRSQPCVSNDTAHGECIDRVVPRNGENACAVRHHDVPALTNNSIASFLQRPNSSTMIDPGQPRHGSYRNVQLAYFDLRHFPNQLLDHAKILLYGAPNVLQGFRFAGALGPAARKTWAGNAVSFFRFPQNHFVSHGASPGVAPFARPSSGGGHTTAVVSFPWRTSGSRRGVAEGGAENTIGLAGFQQAILSSFLRPRRRPRAFRLCPE